MNCHFKVFLLDPRKLNDEKLTNSNQQITVRYYQKHVSFSGQAEPLVMVMVVECESPQSATLHRNISYSTEELFIIS